MLRLNAKQTAWLKIVHLLFVCAWIGGQCSFMLLQLFKGQLTPPETQHVVVAAMKLIDDAVIIPGAIGSLLTGLLYSALTPWGFFQHRWITVKWVSTVVLILFGTFFLGPWVNGMADIAATKKAAALADEMYLQYERMNTDWGKAQLAANLALVVISVFKPWKHLKIVRTKVPLH